MINSWSKTQIQACFEMNQTQCFSKSGASKTHSCFLGFNSCSITYTTIDFHLFCYTEHLTHISTQGWSVFQLKVPVGRTKITSYMETKGISLYRWLHITLSEITPASTKRHIAAWDVKNCICQSNDTFTVDMITASVVMTPQICVKNTERSREPHYRLFSADDYFLNNLCRCFRF